MISQPVIQLWRGEGRCDEAWRNAIGPAMTLIRAIAEPKLPRPDRALCRHGQCGFQSEAVQVGAITEPERIQTILLAIATLVGEPFVDAVVRRPISAADGRKIVSLPRFAKADDFPDRIFHPSAEFFVLRLQNTPNILAEIGLVDVLADQPPVLLGGRLKLGIRHAHDFPDVFQALLKVFGMLQANQLAGIGTVGQTEGVLADDPDRGESDTDGERAVVSVAQEDKLLHFVAGSNHEGITVQLGEDPDARTFAKAASCVQNGFLGLQERLKPLEGVTILQGAIAGTDDAQDAIVRPATDSPMGNVGVGISSNQGCQFDIPIEARFPARPLPVVKVFLRQGRPEAVPGGFAKVSHLLDLMSHVRYSGKSVLVVTRMKRHDSMGRGIRDYIQLCGSTRTRWESLPNQLGGR